MGLTQWGKGDVRGVGNVNEVREGTGKAHRGPWRQMLKDGDTEEQFWEWAWNTNQVS